MILGTLVGSAVEAEAVSEEVTGVKTIVVGSITMVVGSQSAVFVKVAVGRMLVTGSAVDVGTTGLVTTGVEDFETVTNVDDEPPVAVAPAADVAGVDDWVAGAEVSVLLPETPVSTAEEEAVPEAVAGPVTEPVAEPVTEAVGEEVIGPVGSALVLLPTGEPVTELVGALEVPPGGPVTVAEPVTGGSVLVELATEPSELVAEVAELVTETGMVGSEIESGMLRLGVVEGPAEEEVVLAPSWDVAGAELETGDDEVPVGITGGSVKGRDKLGRMPPSEEVVF